MLRLNSGVYGCVNCIGNRQPLHLTKVDTHQENSAAEVRAGRLNHEFGSQGYLDLVDGKIKKKIGFERNRNDRLLAFFCSDSVLATALQPLKNRCRGHVAEYSRQQVPQREATTTIQIRTGG